MSEKVRKCPGFARGYFSSRVGFEQLSEIVPEYGSKIRCIYIQVQKVFILYLFFKNRRIFVKKKLRGGGQIITHEVWCDLEVLDGIAPCKHGGYTGRGRGEVGCRKKSQTLGGGVRQGFLDTEISGGCGCRSGLNLAGES
jgi:hypothetical protein